MEDQVLQIGRVGGVRVMIREVSVNIAKQGINLAPQFGIQAFSQNAPYTVAAIDGDLHGAGQTDIADDALNIVINDALLDQATRQRAGNGTTTLHQESQVLDVVAI